MKTIQGKGGKWIVLLVIFSVLGWFMLGPMIAGVTEVIEMEEEKAHEDEEAGELKTFVCSEGLVSVDLPGNWKETPSVSEDASLQIMNRGQKRVLLIISEPKDASDLEELGGIEGYYQAIIEVMNENLEDSKYEKVDTRTTKKGLPFLCFNIYGLANGTRLSYHVTIYETVDHFHQLVQWSDRSDWDRLVPMFEETAKTFRLAK